MALGQHIVAEGLVFDVDMAEGIAGNTCSCSAPFQKHRNRFDLPIGGRQAVVLTIYEPYVAAE